MKENRITKMYLSKQNFNFFSAIKSGACLASGHARIVVSRLWVAWGEVRRSSALLDEAVDIVISYASELVVE